MTIQKTSKEQVWWHLLQLSFVLGGLAVLIAIVSDKISAALGLSIFTIVVVCSIVLSLVQMRSYKCPDCAGVTKPARGWWMRYAGKKIPFHCSRCDIDWDFGLSGHED